MNSKILLVSKVLPDELVLQILARLPMESIFKFKSVCKLWYKLLSESYFIQLHNEISIINPRVLIEVSNSSQSKPLLICVDRLGGVSNINLDFIKDRVKIKASCHGWLLCSSIPRKGVYYVCNPMTRQYKVLPMISEELNTSFLDGEANFLGLVCDLINRKFSVFLASNKISVCLVYDSETNKWDKFNPLPDDYHIHMNMNQDLFKDQFVYVKGSLYELFEDNSRCIKSVDLKSVVPLPVEVEDGKVNRAYMLEFDGVLSVAQIADSFLTIWVLRDKYIQKWEVVEKLSSRRIRGITPHINRISQSGNFLIFATHKKVVMYNRSTKVWSNLFSVKDGCILPLRFRAHSFRSTLLFLNDSRGQKDRRSIMNMIFEGNQTTSGNRRHNGHQSSTFIREVLSLCDNPAILDIVEPSGIFRADVIRRAREILDQIPGRTTRAFSRSPGIKGLRDTIVAGITARDGFPADPDDIFLTDGVIPAVDLIMQLLISSENDGIMCPIPQNLLYSASIALHGGTLVPYYLEEGAGWGLKISDLEKQLNAARRKEIDVKALVVINPGNPTGRVLAEIHQRDIVEFCKKQNLVLLADETYQENIYVLDNKFNSFKKISRAMGYSEMDFSLVSFRSLSKGYQDKCGEIGGIMEVAAFSPEVRMQLRKVASQNLRSNISGQILASLVMNPPKIGDESYEVYSTEKKSVLSSLARCAKGAKDVLNGLEGLFCQIVEAGIYLFPNIKLPEKAIKAAEYAKIAPDDFYCRRLLNATNISVLPGSAFGQVHGSWHFRCSLLDREEHEMVDFITIFTNFHTKFMEDFRD